jgi:hypothetical protein
MAISLVCLLWVFRTPRKPKVVGKAVTLDELADRIAREAGENGPTRDEIMRILSEALDAKKKRERAEP